MNFTKSHIALLALTILGTISHNTHTMMPRLATALVGDTCLATVLTSQTILHMSAETKKIFNEKISPEVRYQLAQDSNTVAPYTPYLIGAAMILSPGARISMIARTHGIMKKALVLPVTVALLPINTFLVAKGYEFKVLNATK